MVMGNRNLHAAKRAANDEFYTQWVDIEREMNAYLEHDPDVFRDKTVLLPCDDPEWSEFTRYFTTRFKDLGLKKLISTSYAPNSNPNTNTDEYQPTLFEQQSPQYDAAKSLERGRLFTLTRKQANNGEPINTDNLEWTYLEGDGDFRSPEVTALRDEADMVITNPPFSLFREFLAWLEQGNVEYAVIGNQNAVTYKEVFPLIQANRVWLGGYPGTTTFGVPDHLADPTKWGYHQDEQGKHYVKMRSATWFTNLDHGRRHEPLQLMTMEQNLRYGPKQVREHGYPTYDNYDAIEVGRVADIPKDWDGKMGVPVDYLGHHNPNQFRIVGSYNNGHPAAQLGATFMRIIAGGVERSWNGPAVGGKPLYKRVVIERVPHLSKRRPANPNSEDNNAET